MMERFTEGARRFIILAREECRRLHHGSLGPEHLLLGLILEHSFAATFLERLGLRLERVRVEVEQALARFPTTLPGADITFTPAAKLILELSVQEARQRGGKVTAVDILLGLMKEGESLAAKILASHGARLDGRQEVLFVLFGRQYRLRRHVPISAASDGLREIARRGAREAERGALTEVLNRVRWNLAEAARILRVSEASLGHKITELGLGPATA